MPKLFVYPLGAAALLLAGAMPRVHAEALQSQDTNISGITAEITECKRKNDVLTVKLRFVNTGGAPARIKVINGRNFDEYYVTAENKKYFILRDAENVPLAPAADGSGSISVEVGAGGGWTWWAKYPAPPAEVTAVTFYTPHAPPFEDVPVSD